MTQNEKAAGKNASGMEMASHFDSLKDSIPNKVLSSGAFNKKSKELINNLAFVYNLDTLKVGEIIRLTSA